MKGEQRPGDFRVICDYSGFKVWASETVMTHDGYRVARRFAGSEQNKHPQEYVRAVKDNQTVRNARPEAADTFIETPITAADL